MFAVWKFRAKLVPGRFTVVFYRFLCSLTSIVLSSELIASTDVGKSRENPLIVQGGTTEQSFWEANTEHTARLLFYSAVNLEPIYLTSDYRLLPGYIKSWQYFETENKFRLTIDNDLKFHNGKNLESGDFEYLLIKMRIAPSQSYFKKDFSEDIVGLKDLKRGTKYRSGMCSGIKVIDTRTIDIFLTNKNKRFLYSLANLDIPIAPIDSFKEDHQTWKSTPIGLGDYKVIEANKEGTDVLLKNTNSENEIKYIRLLNKGNASNNSPHIAIGTGTIGLKSASSNHRLSRVKSENPSMVVTIDFNFSSEIGSNRNFRKVVYSVLKSKNVFTDDRFSKTNTLYPNLTIKTSNLLDGVSEASNEVKELLRKHAIDLKNPIRMFYSAGPKSRDIPNPVKTIVEILNKKGLPTKPIGTDSTKFKSKDAANGIILKLSASSLDLSNQFNVFAKYLPGEGNLFNSKYDNEFKKYYSEGISSSKYEDRIKNLKNLEKLNRREYIQIPLAHGFEVYYYDKKLISEAGMFGLDVRLNLSNIKLKKTPGGK